MSLLPGIVYALFNLENNSIHFEHVCIDLYNAAEGVELVPTSRTWDRGRDGHRKAQWRGGCGPDRCFSLQGSIRHHGTADGRDRRMKL